MTSRASAAFSEQEGRTGRRPLGHMTLQPHHHPPQRHRHVHLARPCVALRSARPDSSPLQLQSANSVPGLCPGVALVLKSAIQKRPVQSEVAEAANLSAFITAPCRVPLSVLDAPRPPTSPPFTYLTESQLRTTMLGFGTCPVAVWTDILTKRARTHTLAMPPRPDPAAVDDWITPIVRRELRNLIALENPPDNDASAEIPPPSNEDAPHYDVLATYDDLTATLSVSFSAGTTKYFRVSNLALPRFLMPVAHLFPGSQAPIRR
jgi:hypothetical protein